MFVMCEKSKFSFDILMRGHVCLDTCLLVLSVENNGISESFDVNCGKFAYTCVFELFIKISGSPVSCRGRCDYAIGKKVRN